MTKETEPAVNVERETIRGRACPSCGGKIIPSDRAVYQNPGDPSAVVALWQCERCGHEEVVEKKAPPSKPGHARKQDET